MQEAKYAGVVMAAFSGHGDATLNITTNIRCATYAEEDVLCCVI